MYTTHVARSCITDLDFSLDPLLADFEAAFVSAASAGESAGERSGGYHQVEGVPSSCRAAHHAGN